MKHDMGPVVCTDIYMEGNGKDGVWMVFSDSRNLSKIVPVFLDRTDMESEGFNESENMAGLVRFGLKALKGASPDA